MKTIYTLLLCILLVPTVSAQDMQYMNRPEGFDVTFVSRVKMTLVKEYTNDSQVAYSHKDRSILIRAQRFTSIFMFKEMAERADLSKDIATFLHLTDLTEVSRISKQLDAETTYETTYVRGQSGPIPYYIATIVDQERQTIYEIVLGCMDQDPEAGKALIETLRLWAP